MSSNSTKTKYVIICILRFELCELLHCIYSLTFKNVFQYVTNKLCKDTFHY